MTHLINGSCLGSKCKPCLTCLINLAYKGISFCYYCLIYGCNCIFYFRHMEIDNRIRYDLLNESFVLAFT